jgi:sporulation protein YlmC with PRC-barrel domain
MASDSSSHKGEWRTSKLMGLDVYNDNNEKLGDINEVLVDKSGKITAVVIGVGGFLGIGENDVAVSFDKLKFVNEPVAYAAGSGSSNTAGNRPAGNAATGAPMTTTGTSTPSGAATTPAPMTTTGTGTGTGATGSGAAGASSGMTGSGSASSSSAAASRSNPWYPDHAVLSATKDQLKSMTQFKYSDQ